jgi:hypothetical protein
MHVGDIGCGRDSGKAFLRRQGSEIYSTDPLRQMRRQRPFDSALARSSQKGWLRNSRLRVLRVRAPNLQVGKGVTHSDRCLVASIPVTCPIISQTAQALRRARDLPHRSFLQALKRRAGRSWRKSQNGKNLDGKGVGVGDSYTAEALWPERLTAWELWGPAPATNFRVGRAQKRGRPIA